MKTAILSGAAMLLASTLAFGHGKAGDGEPGDPRRIEFPDTAKYKTIVFDPHTHSVFSDGHVWPNIRIAEALKDGLDAIAITEHLEYQPHLLDIPHPDRNRAFAEASAAAVGTDLIVVAGSEITRRGPAGHMNAIFITDANKLIASTIPDKPVDPGQFYRKSGEWPAQNAVEAANEQGAFVFWNHAYWTPDFPNGIAVIPDFHRNNASKGLLHGIEIANGDSYSEETFQIALDHNLALIGVSDVHNLIDWDYEPHKGGHRPVTLVLAKERTMASMREAMFDLRTVVWYKNMLIGRPAHLNPLLEASLTISDATYGEGEIMTVTLNNNSDANFQLMNRSDYSFYTDTDLVEVPAHESIKLRVKTPKKVKRIALEFDVLNALIAPKKNASIELKARVE